MKKELIIQLVKESSDRTNMTILETARVNKVLYHIGSELTNDPNIEKELKDHHKRYIKTLKIMNECIGAENYLLAKTVKRFEFLFHDLDVLVKQLNRYKQPLLSEGFNESLETRKNLQGKYKYGVEKEGYLDIELHSRISWGRLCFMDNSLNWKKRRWVQQDGVEFAVPSIEADILTLIAHINFQTYEIHIVDLIYLFDLIPKADMGILIKQTKKYGWKDYFCESLQKLNGLYNLLYNKQLIKGCKPAKINKSKLYFPYVLKPQNVLLGLVQKDFKSFPKFLSYSSIFVKYKNKALHNYINRIMDGRLSEFYLKKFY